MECVTAHLTFNWSNLSYLSVCGTEAKLKGIVGEMERNSEVNKVREYVLMKLDYGTL